MNKIEIINYRPDLKEYVKKLNEEWLNKYFSVEPSDVIQLGDPQKEIIDKGGQIYYITVNGEIAGTVSLMKVNEDTYELAKMAVSERFQGNKLGDKLMQFCIGKAQEMKIKKLILYSNTSLEPAIHLYKKYGFYEIPLNTGQYKRSNIKMEKIIEW
jgi:ribosomal protein S18 acetylase RimI-like enzyme